MGEGLKRAFAAVKAANCKHKVLIVTERHEGGAPKVKFCRTCQTSFHILSNKQIVEMAQDDSSRVDSSK